MKKKLFGKCAVFLLGCITFCSSITAFDGPTHKYITKTCLEAISKIDEEPENSNETNFKNFYDAKHWDVLIEYSAMPDEDEKGKLSLNECHFYSPKTGKNFLGKKDTALSRSIKHYDKAVELYTAKDTKKDVKKKKSKKIDTRTNIEKAYEELGRSFHFMQDICTPVHTRTKSLVDAGIKLPMHIEFENICRDMHETCEAKVDPESLKNYELSSVEAIGKAAAVVSANDFDSLLKNTLKDIIIARKSVLNAQKEIIGMLYKFHKQVSKQADTVKAVGGKKRDGRGGLTGESETAPPIQNEYFV